MKNLFSVQDKVIVITGAAGVLGTSMVHHFAEQGAKVVILDRNEEAGRRLEEEVKAEGGEVMFLYTDVLDKQVLEGNYTEIMARYGRIDVLINGAGGNMAGATIAPDKTIFDLDIEAVRKVVDLNLFGIILPTMTFHPGDDRAEAGIDHQHLVGIGDPAAYARGRVRRGESRGDEFYQIYVRRTGHQIRRRTAGKRHRARLLHHGAEPTLLLNPDGSYTERSKTILAHTPYGRFGEPSELLGTLQWLASDASKFVSGTMTVIDGGFDAFSI